MTPIRRKNLEKLATYLESLPANYRHFGMDRYAVHDPNRSDYEPCEDFPCGTVACALGHGPAAGITSAPHETWEDYAHRFVDDDSQEWSWLFGGQWSAFDNTHRGAAARIRYFLDHKVPDQPWYGEQYQANPEFYNPNIYAEYLK